MRPIVITIDYNGPNETDNGDNFPTGFPVATCIRPMTWLENLKYKWKKVRKKQHDNVLVPMDNNVPHATIGIRISENQYAKIIHGDPENINLVDYLLKSQRTISMDLIPPKPQNGDYKEYTV